MEQTLIPCEDDALALMAGMPDVATVSALEEVMLQYPQVDAGTLNLIHGGMCARTILIPAGNMLTGALTNCDNTCIVCGDITVTTDEGPQRITGYQVIPAKAGTKRVGYTHADTWWTMVWRTDLTDLEAIEDELTCESGMLQSRRGAESVEHDRNDFALFMREFNLSPEFMLAVANYTDDHAPAPVGTDTLALRPSKISGNGSFSTKSHAKGETLAPMRINGMRTPAGRYINHSPKPNAEAFSQGDDLWCRALRDIGDSEEITLDYRQVVEVNPVFERQMQ